MKKKRITKALTAPQITHRLDSIQPTNLLIIVG